MPLTHGKHMAKAEDYLIIAITEFIKQHLDHNRCCRFSLILSAVMKWGKAITVDPACICSIIIYMWERKRTSNSSCSSAKMGSRLWKKLLISSVLDPPYVTFTLIGFSKVFDLVAVVSISDGLRRGKMANMRRSPLEAGFAWPFMLC